MNKREFTIGLGAGLLIASALSLAGYISVLSDYGAVADDGGGGTSIAAAYEKNDEVKGQVGAPDVSASPENESDDISAGASGDENTKKGEEGTRDDEIANDNSPQEEEKLGALASNAEDDVEEQADVLVAQPPPSESDSVVYPEEVPKEEVTIRETSPVQQESVSEPAAQPIPQPAPQPEPQPTPQPAPQPETQPTPQPEPQPTSQPAHQPEPQSAPQPAQSENSRVKVTITENATNEEIANAMRSQGVVGNEAEFADYLNKTGLYVKYKPGEYEFDADSTYDEIVENMMKGN